MKESGSFEKLKEAGVPRAMVCTGRSGQSKAGQVSGGLRGSALAGLAREALSGLVRPFRVPPPSRAAVGLRESCLTPESVASSLKWK